MKGSHGAGDEARRGARWGGWNAGLHLLGPRRGVESRPVVNPIATLTTLVDDVY